MAAMTYVATFCAGFCFALALDAFWQGRTSAGWWNLAAVAFNIGVALL